MRIIKPWVFRVLVLGTAGFMVYTWLQPWWSAYIVELEVEAVTIYAWQMLVEMNGYEHWLAGYETAMPAWFFPFMWVYLGICMAALLFSMFASSAKGISIGKRIRISLPAALIAAVGVSYIVVVAAAVLTISMKAGDFYDAPLIGTIHVAMSDFEASDVDVGLLPGFFLACAAGPLLIVLAALRNLIVGKPKL